MRRLPRATAAAVGVLAFVAALAAFVLIPSRVSEESAPEEAGRAPSVSAPGDGASGAEGSRPGNGEVQGRPEGAGQPGPVAEGAEANGSVAQAQGRSEGLRMVRRVNRARAEEGRAELVIDEDLSSVASAHVEEMVARGRLYHTSTDTLGRRVTNWQVLAESIGVGPDVGSLFDALMSSAADRRNLLDPSFHHIGVGASRQGDRLWITLLFSDRNDPGTIL